MKSLHILLALALFGVASPSVGQTPSEFYKQHLDNYTWKEGVITKKDGQQVAGLIQHKLKNENKGYKNIHFIAIDGVEKETYSAKELQSFTVSLYRYISYKEDFYEIAYQGKRIALLKRLTFDPLKYQTMPTHNTQGPSNQVIHDGYEITFFFRKEGEENLYKVVDMKKKLSTYFSDCESLAGKIKAGEYKMGGALSLFPDDPDKKQELLVEIVGYYDYCQ